MSATAVAGSVQATASLAPSTCHVGDLVTLTVSVIHPKGFVPEAPATIASGQEVRLPVGTGGALGDLEIVKAEAPAVKDAPGDQQETRFVYNLRSFDIGSHETPELVVSVKPPEGSASDVKLAAQKLEVSSVLPQAQAVEPGKETTPLEIREIKAPLRVAPDYTLWAIILASAAVFALGCFLLARRLRRTKTPVAPEIPRLPPRDEVLAALDDLKRRGLPASGLWKELAFLLSEILRRYVGRTFEIQALESTTRELMRDLAETDLADKARMRLRKILEETDLVKFAKMVPPLSLEGELFAEAYAFVDEARPTPAPQPLPEPVLATAEVAG